MSLLARLIEAGTPADLIEEVAMVIAEKRAAEHAVEERKAKARDRQARKRERDALSRDVTECHVTGCDITSAPLSLPPNDNNSNPPAHTPEEQTPRARKADDFPCPDWADSRVWADLKRNRRTKRLTNTATAHKRFISDVMAMADDDWPPGRLVEAIAAKGWGGAYDPRDKQEFHNGKDIRQRGPSGPDKRSGLARAIDNGLERTQSAFPENLTLVGGDAPPQSW